MKRSMTMILATALALATPAAMAQSKTKAKAKTKTESTKKSAKGKTSTTTTTETESTTATDSERPAVGDAVPDSSAPALTTPPSETATTTTTETTTTNPAATTPAPAAPSENVDSVSDGNHYFGFNVAAGAPVLTQGGLNYIHSSHMFSGELQLGSFGIDSGDVKASIGKTEAAFRWHPWMGSFFAGVAVGQQKLSGEATDTISSQPIFVKLDVNTTFAAPHIGWMWGAMNGGFFGSIDLGYQMAMSSSATFDSNADASVKATADYAKIDKDARDTGKMLGEQGLPRLSFKIGWLF